MFSRVKQRLASSAARRIEKSVSLAARKQAKGAITFQYRMFGPKKIDWNQINSLRNRFNFSDVYLFHGVAMNVGGNAVVVSGPRGMGKTTLLKNLAKSKIASPIEDGLVVVGRSPKGLFVVETGTYDWRNKRANVKKIFPSQGASNFKKNGFKENFSPFNTSVFLEGAFSETVANILTRDKSKNDFSSKQLPLKRLIIVPHEKDLHKPIKIVGNSIESINSDNAKEELSRFTETVSFSPNITQVSLLKKIQLAIFK